MICYDMFMELYEWQRQCLAAWEENHCKGIANVITGAGKTYLAIAACSCLLSRYGNLHIRIVVPTIALMHQWRTSLRTHADFLFAEERLGLYYSRHKDTDCRITIYCIGSARYAFARHTAHDLGREIPVFIIADECHHYGSRENRHIFDFISAKEKYPAPFFTLGLSATAFGGSDDRFLIHALGRRIFRYGFQSAVSDGIISPFAIYQVAAKFSADEAGAYDALTLKLSRLYQEAIAAHPLLGRVSDHRFFPLMKRYAEAAGMDSDDPCAGYLRQSYARKEITVLADARIQCAISLIRTLPADTRILIYCERIIQASEIYALLQEAFPGSCGLYHSQMTPDARNRIIRSFREREIRLLISCRCLDEGIDVPDASVGVIVSGSSASRQHIQRLGRILRKSTDKSLALLYYVYVDQSAEDHAFLGNRDGFPIVNARYDAQEHAFICPDYESAAADILAEERMSQEQRKEFIRCIEEGAMRGDFLLPAGALKEKAHLSTDTHKKNYYLCMRHIAQKLFCFDEKEPSTVPRRFQP